MNVFIDIEYPALNKEQTSSSPQERVDQQKTLQAEVPKKTSKQPEKGGNFKVSHWIDSEHRKYVSFLIKNGHIFLEDQQTKRRKRPHALMSKYIRTKNTLQCRSHHQKMLQKHKSIEKIIAFYTPQEKHNQNQPKEEVFKTTINFQQFESIKESMPHDLFQLQSFENPFEQCQLNGFNSPIHLPLEDNSLEWLISE